MVVERVLLVRHGETDYNQQRRWQGQLDTPLNENGRKQAQALAKKIIEYSVDAIYSSDLSRAAETATILASALELPVIPEPRLREMHVGIFQGLNREQIHQQYPYEMHCWTNDDTYVPHGGESRAQLQLRAYEALQELMQKKHRTLLLVTHGGTIRLLLQKIMPHAQLNGLHFANTSLTILKNENDKFWRAEQIADASHLPRL